MNDIVDDIFAHKPDGFLVETANQESSSETAMTTTVTSNNPYLFLAT